MANRPVDLLELAAELRAVLGVLARLNELLDDYEAHLLREKRDLERALNGTTLELVTD
jgi:hypothetical protein